MAQVTLEVGGTFPVGTVVSVYGNAGRSTAPSGPPSGTAVTSATVATDSTVTFDGLFEDSAYYAYALVGSTHTYLSFMVGEHDGDANDPVYVATGADPLVVEDAPATALGIFALSTTGAAVALSTVSGGIPATATFIDFVPTVDVTYTDDGSTTPTATVGIPVAAGQAWRIAVASLSNVTFYGGVGVINGGFYR